MHFKCIYLKGCWFTITLEICIFSAHEVKNMDMETIQLRCSPEVKENLTKIKKDLGVVSNAEVIRFLIQKQVNRVMKNE